MNSLRNVLKTLSVCLLLTLTVLGLGLLANAQAPVAAPAITFNQASDVTLHKSTTFYLPVRADVTDPAGIQSASISSPVCGGSAQMNGATRGSVTVYFFVGYYPNGDYTFTAHAADVHGAKSAKSITVHLEN